MRKILIVDDEFHVIEGLKLMIEWERLKVDRVLTASDGLEAWELFQKERPDLVLTDVSMPKMNGLQLASKIREADANIPILILSGFDDFEYARGALHLQVAKYILKPAVFTEIQEALEEALAELEAAGRRDAYMNQFVEQMKQNVPILREQFLYDLVTTGKPGHEVDESTLTFYELDPYVTRGAVVVSVALYRSQHERAAKEKDWQLFKYSTVNIAEELREMLQVAVYVLRYVDDRLLLLLMNTDSSQALSDANRLGEELIRQVAGKLEIDMNIGIGRWVGQASDYPLSYQESLESLKWIEYDGCNKIGTAQSFKHVQAYVPDYSMDRVKLLVECMRNHEVQEAMHNWTQIESEVMKSPPPLFYVQNLCVSLISRMMLELLPEEQPLSANLHHIVQDIYNIRTVESILTVVRGLLDEMLLTMQRQYNVHRQNGYIQKISEYVEEHYHENISFADLAKQLHVTRNYLSFLFKKDRGMSFMTYLTAFRVQKAKELLRTRQHLVYEVAELVGYSDAAYFSRVFKNAVGITPAEYAMGLGTIITDERESHSSL
jgi:YesN/AraC family two-component response regulator